MRATENYVMLDLDVVCLSVCIPGRASAQSPVLAATP